MVENQKYIDVKFYKLWKHVRITRLQKEKIKRSVFPVLAPFIRRLATYQNWKESRVFIADGRNRTPQNNVSKGLPGIKSIKLAIVVHVFYLDIFESILNKILSNKPLNFSLFITCPKDLAGKIDELLKGYDLSAEILTVENHGRDILPFLKILPMVLKRDFNLILKLHTKRSNHLNKKDTWSSDLFNKLIENSQILNNIEVFKSDLSLGMLGPEGHILPMSLYYGGNAMRVRMLCVKMGLRTEQFKGMNFVAGSMFYARREVLKHILKTDLKDHDFEKESNQLDNTMAHAVERAFAAGIILSGLKLGDSNSTNDNINCNVVANHPFTI